MGLLTLGCIIAILLFVVVHLQRRAERPPPSVFGTSYSGMTTKERLYAAGMIDDFNVAREAHDVDAMVAILQQIDLAYPESLAIAEAIAKDPAKYKF